MDKNLCIYPYNSRGFDSNKQDILKTLLSVSGDSLPVICNQENFLLKANRFIIEKCLPDQTIICSSSLLLKKTLMVGPRMACL